MLAKGMYSQRLYTASVRTQQGCISIIVVTSLFFASLSLILCTESSCIVSCCALCACDCAARVALLSAPDTFGAFCLTETEAGSDSFALRTRAVKQVQFTLCVTSQNFAHFISSSLLRTHVLYANDFLSHVSRFSSSFFWHLPCTQPFQRRQTCNKCICISICNCIVADAMNVFQAVRQRKPQPHSDNFQQLQRVLAIVSPAFVP